MEVEWVVIGCHGLVTLVVVVAFLCGQWPIFQGTPIERLHLFLTFGAYDYFLRFVGFVFGSRGTDAVLSVERFCCDRPNPILQFLYLGIIGGTYYFIASSSFRYIPGYYLGETHIYTSLLAVGIGVLLFLLTSFSDPGTVNADNVSAYVAAYPYDNIIYTEKECPTCKIPKPARSKHCSICDRCVARFDHHCGWMNNCIGERNTRFFLAFLIWHFLLCVYGTVALGLLLAGRLKELKIVHILTGTFKSVFEDLMSNNWSWFSSWHVFVFTVYYGVDNSFSSLAPHVVQWLLGSYNTQILLIVFLAVVSLLLIGFFTYHMNLCLTNTTTNETFKWQEHISLQRKLNEARASAAALRASIARLNTGAKTSESKCRNCFRRSPLQDAETAAKRNVYNKGFFHNTGEVMLPFSKRSSFLTIKSKCG